MASTGTTGQSNQHRLLHALDTIEATLRETRDVEPAFMSTDDKAQALLRLTSIADQVGELTLRVMVEADDVADQIGARNAGQWLARSARITGPTAHGTHRLAQALREHPRTSTALAHGTLRLAQAREILAAVQALPTSLGAEILQQAEAHLIHLADDHDALTLRRIGKHILDVVAPDVAEHHEQARLDREEARAAATASVTMYDDGEGRVHGKFILPSHQGLMLRRALTALANPVRHHPDDLRDAHGQWRPTPERLGTALGEYIERYPTDRLPHSGGINATVVVTLDHGTLLRDLGTATLDDGTRITAALARQLACEAGILPAVLAGKSEILDLGRTRRLHSKAQRVAIAHRDHGCTAQHCDIPAGGCHTHHDQPWSQGGHTNLTNARLLCPRHHRLIHNHHYETRLTPDNKVTFHRRT